MKPLRISRDLTPREAEEIIGTCSCDAQWTGEVVAHCATCHLTFGSVSGFDDHRDRREGRCRSTDELRTRGLEPNESGYWRKPRPPETLPSR